MIIVELNGGLGNQLFQYASAKSLALHCRTTLKLDTRFFTAAGKSHDLVYFHIDDPNATEDEIISFEKRSIVRKLAERLKPNHTRIIYRETDYTFDDNFFKASCSVYLKGLRQSEKYFLAFASDIKKLLQVRQEYVKHLSSIKDEITNCNSVSIHIRRGDYLTKVALEVLGLQPLAYYENAIQQIAAQVTDPVCYIFSDDIDWAKENLKIGYPHHYASGYLSRNTIEDFYLMSQCKHDILANSTFSWWGAWLSTHAEKTVIAPARWFDDPESDYRDVIPAEWHRI